eukprot:3921184-Prymnesium_polylepis.1
MPIGPKPGSEWVCGMPIGPKPGSEWVCGMSIGPKPASEWVCGMSIGPKPASESRERSLRALSSSPSPRAWVFILSLMARPIARTACSCAFFCAAWRRTK